MSRSRAPKKPFFFTASQPSPMRTMLSPPGFSSEIRWPFTIETVTADALLASPSRSFGSPAAARARAGTPPPAGRRPDAGKAFQPVRPAVIRSPPVISPAPSSGSARHPARLCDRLGSVIGSARSRAGTRRPPGSGGGAGSGAGEEGAVPLHQVGDGTGRAPGEALDRVGQRLPVAGPQRHPEGDDHAAHLVGDARGPQLGVQLVVGHAEVADGTARDLRGERGDLVEAEQLRPGDV